MIEPYWTSKDGRQVIYCGDCLDVLPTFCCNYVDSIVSDVPYGVNYDNWDGDLPSQYILNECLRISENQIFWFGASSKILEFSRYNPKPDRLFIWSPSFTLSRTGSNGYFYRWHPIAAWRVQKQRHIAWDIFYDNTEGGNWWNHPATKPVSLMKKLVVTCGESVCDPFMGSGTTGVACVRLNRRFIGIEISEEYRKIAVERIKRELSQPRLELEEQQSFEQASMLHEMESNNG